MRWSGEPHAAGRLAPSRAREGVSLAGATLHDVPYTEIGDVTGHDAAARGSLPLGDGFVIVPPWEQSGAARTA